MFPIPWQKKFELVGCIEIVFYFEILFLFRPLVAESFSWKVWLTYHMRDLSRIDLYVHKNQSRKRSFFNKTSRFTFLSKIDGFVKEKIVISRTTSLHWRPVMARAAILNEAVSATSPLNDYKPKFIKIKHCFWKTEFFFRWSRRIFLIGRGIRNKHFFFLPKAEPYKCDNYIWEWLFYG